ncbi:MAG: pyridoxal phosphate-dependent aminotransferase [Deltaproteobacteria bacterium]|jgi:aspartate aminotransferase|nr:pyridoxal phosphate-dependent aminotransferase [Deltaproteobacteria bacterium]
MLISQKMNKAISGGSMVRRMFDEGVRLKTLHGPDKVFDYSLGNPDLTPPTSFVKVVTNILQSNMPGIHGYMTNAGWPDVRDKLAAYLNKTIGHELKKPLDREQVIMTAGAAGAMNCVFKAVLDPGSKVIALAPYFMEYNFYVSNHGGELLVAETDASFRPDPEDLDNNITDDTRAVIINSPNNPTGVIYTKEDLKAIGDVLTKASRRLGRPILLISDEPYRKLVFNDKPVPSVFTAYPYSVVVNSFSKDLSLAGERIGYIAINPEMPGAEVLASAVTLANRILGFVNAPSLMQKAVVELLEESGDLNIYRRRQDLLVGALNQMGYELVKPDGTFYLFPKSPVPDDLAFTEILREELILAVPGCGFARAGYFRLSLCLKEELIEASLAGFARAINRARQLN